MPRLLLLTVLALLSGCGQKGPLFLPPAPGAATPESAPAAAAEPADAAASAAPESESRAQALPAAQP